MAFGKQRRQHYIGMLFLLLCFNIVSGQNQNEHLGFDFISKKASHHRISFQLYNNLIVVPAILNNKKDTLNFVVDTGVNPTIITDTTFLRRLKIDSTNRKVAIKGVNDELPIIGFVAPHINVRIGRLSSPKHSIIVLSEDLVELSEYAGVKIHGIIGYDLMANFVVEIDYISKTIAFFKKEKYYKKKSNQRKVSLPIILEKNKPYIQAQVFATDTNKTRVEADVKLLLDTGAGFSVSLEATENVEKVRPKQTIQSKIGNSITGNVEGDIGRIQEFKLGTFSWSEVICSFPDSSYQMMTDDFKRDGSIGVGILGRFKITFDYSGKKILLQPNKKYKDAFEFALSGLDIIAKSPTYKDYMIMNVHEHSPAFEAGLKSGDIIVSINEKLTSELKIGEIYDIIDKKVGRQINMLVRRGNRLMFFSFVLRKVL